MGVTKRGHPQALSISEIGILQEEGSELLVRAHHLPNVILDFETGMHHGPIVSSSDKSEEREQRLKAFAAQCLPHCLLGALGLCRVDKDQSGSCKYPVFDIAVWLRPIEGRFEGRQTLVNRIKLSPPGWRHLEKLERLLNRLGHGRGIA